MSFQGFISRPGNYRYIVLASSALSAVVGSLVTYRFVSKTLKAQYSAEAEVEIDQMREYFAQKNEEKFYETKIVVREETTEVPVDEDREEDFATMADILKSQQYVSYDKVSTISEDGKQVVVEVPPTVQKNVFEGRVPVPADLDEYDAEVENAKRRAGEVYVMTDDEYFENADNWQQDDLTYFEQDKILMDQNEVAIDDPRRIVGEGNLRFGVGSNDSNIVYLSNPVRGVHYAVTRSTGSYSLQVMGMPPVKNAG